MVRLACSGMKQAASCSWYTVPRASICAARLNSALPMPLTPLPRRVSWIYITATSPSAGSATSRLTMPWLCMSAVVV
jgi:hypothetical protein